MDTPPTQTMDRRSEVLKKMAELALKKAALKEVLATFETQIAAIQKAILDATVEDAAAIENLETWLKEMALRFGIEIFGKDARSVTQGALTLAVKEVDKVEVEGDEEEVIATLQKAAKSHPDTATKLAAAACLRTKVTINKEFVRQNWELFGPWFIIFGLKVVESESASLAERKPAKPKAPKPLKAKKPRAGKKAAMQEPGKAAA